MPCLEIPPVIPAMAPPAILETRRRAEKFSAHPQNTENP
ncbi:hypothetical protein [Azospirillum argentinense]